MKNLLDRIKIADGWDKGGSMRYKDVATVWGDKDADSPYDRTRYHLGQLSMLCALAGLSQLQCKVHILLTSDNYPRKTGYVAQSLYNSRKRGLMSWVKSMVGNNLIVTDAALRYEQIRTERKQEYSFWTVAGDKLRDFLTEIAVETNGFKKNERGIWHAFKKDLEECRINDNGWQLSIQKGPEPIREWIENTFSSFDYKDIQDDLGALTYLLLFRGGRWVDWLQRNWVAECGAVISSEFGSGLLVEAERNMYWLRALRLLYQYTRQVLKKDALFPDVGSFVNLPNRNCSGPMMGKDRRGIIPIFAPSTTLYDFLIKADQDFLNEFSIRLLWAKKTLPVVSFLEDALPSIKISELSRALSEVIFESSVYWPQEKEESIRIDNWYCIRYASEVMTHLSPKQRWTFSIDPSSVSQPSTDTSAHETTAKLILSALYKKQLIPDAVLALPAAQVIVENTSAIDTILHMTEKRYRDHAQHQINVAVLGHLLLNSLAPKSSYIRPEKVVDRIVELLNDDIEPDEFSDLFLIAAFMHDHGYPLLQVAWLIGRLHKMRATDAKDGGLASSNLAQALKEYVLPFSSKWYQSILDQVEQERSCDAISLKYWNMEQKGWTANLLGKTQKELDDKVKWPTHGIIGAINFLQMIQENEHISISFHENKHLCKILRAIAVHDFPGVEISITEDPIAFFLILCDEIQEWSRPIFWEGRATIESPYVSLVGLTRLDDFLLQFSDVFHMHFKHLGTEATMIPWEYDVFRQLKKQNIDRLDPLAHNLPFPTTISFDLCIGP